MTWPDLQTFEMIEERHLREFLDDLDLKRKKESYDMRVSRRDFLAASAAIPLAGLSLHDGVAEEPATGKGSVLLHAWERDPRNPIFVPRSEFDANGAQGPFVVLHDAEWQMVYAGIG